MLLPRKAELFRLEKSLLILPPPKLTGSIYDMLRFKSWSKRQIDISRNANPNAPCLPTIGVITSHGTLNSSIELIDQVRILRELNAQGASFFRWEKLEQWVDPLKKDAYQKAVEVP